MSFLSDVLTVGGVQQDDIARLERVLDLHAAALHDGRPPEPGGAMFGGSPAGADLDLQTVRAYEHVREAIDELVAGLRGYRDNISRFARDLEDTDGGVQGDLSNRTAALDAIESCTTAGDFHNRDACAPPADGGDA